MSNSNAFRSKVGRTAGALALVLAAVATPVAHADSELIVKHVTVRFSHLNVQNEAGAQKLIARLEQAAIEACGGRTSAGPMTLYVSTKRQFDACRVDAVKTAVATLDRPMVTAVYEGKRSPANRLATR